MRQFSLGPTSVPDPRRAHPTLVRVFRFEHYEPQQPGSLLDKSDRGLGRLILRGNCRFSTFADLALAGVAGSHAMRSFGKRIRLAAAGQSVALAG